jgi:imidazolonepropionase-like amidohydrolase
MAAPLQIARSFADATNSGLIPGPVTLTCINGITRKGGPGGVISMAVETVEEAVAAVDRLAESGADFIKVFASGDGSAENQPLLGPDEIKAVFRRAASYGLKVIAHATTLTSIMTCVDSGVFCIEHGPELDLGAARAMAENGMWFVPTLSGFAVIGHDGGSWGRPPHVIKAFAACLDDHIQAVRHAAEAGVRMAVGTDSLGTMQMELNMLLECGLTPKEAIKAASGAGAALLGMQSGRIEPGFYANLIVVPGDPLSDLVVLTKPTTVYVRGREYVTEQVRSAFGISVDE